MGTVTKIVERVRSLPEVFIVLTLAVVMGIAIGSLVELMKWCLRWMGNAFAPLVVGKERYCWWLLLLPLTGILLTSIYQRFVIKNNLEDGSAKVKQTLREGDSPRMPDSESSLFVPFHSEYSAGEPVRKTAKWYYIRSGVILNSLFCCAMTVGFGSSAGTEAPAAYSGAALGSGLARRLGLNRNWCRLLVSIGAGAGIAAIFKAPIGGALYSLEVLRTSMTTVPVMALLLCCVTSAATSYMISGSAFDMSIPDIMRFDFSMLGWVTVIGVICGFYSLWYNWSRLKTDAFFHGIRSPWVKVLISGVGMSVVVFLIPGLFGEGWGVLNSIANRQFPEVFDRGLFATAGDTGWIFFVLTGVILLIKGVLVSAANNGGGVAGDMVPSLYIGGIAGYVSAVALNAVFGLDLPVWYLSLAGMGALLGNASHAPLMAAFLVYECTNTAQFLPGYLLCTLISYLVVNWVSLRNGGDRKRDRIVR